MGSVMALAIATVAAAVGALRHVMPRLNISFEVETSDILIARLLANQLDLIVARIPSNADPTLFDYQEIAQERAGS